MPATFDYKFDTASVKTDVSVPLGLYIDGKWVDAADKSTIDVINPTNGSVITSVAGGGQADVDAAVKAARKALDTTWGLNMPGAERGKLLYKLAELMERDADKIAALEVLDNGKTFFWARNGDVAFSINTIRYYAGWADKNSGQVSEISEEKLAYTRHEPVGVCGQILPWNFPVMLLGWKLGPALATGNAVIIKPSEFTPLTSQYVVKLTIEAGFPPGVVNIINGYGNSVGQALAEHMDIDKISFTGSTLIGRKIMETAGRTNLKNVTLELGGKSPNIIFDDADLEQAVKWTSHGIYWNHGQTCCAGTRVFVQAGIYDKFMQAFKAKVESIKLGDPFATDVNQGPQVSEQQYDRIMAYIDSGKKDGATVELGGARHGTEGYFIQPTIFTNTKPNMRIVQEEIFGPVGVLIRFEDEDDVIRQANDTLYGLASAVFSQDIKKALRVAHRLKAGTAWVNCVNTLDPQVPFGGYKQSGIGRELGEYALATYTSVKAVHVNLSMTPPP